MHNTGYMFTDDTEKTETLFSMISMFTANSYSITDHSRPVSNLYGGKYFQTALIDNSYENS